MSAFFLLFFYAHKKQVDRDDGGDVGRYRRTWSAGALEAVWVLFEDGDSFSDDGYQAVVEGDDEPTRC